MSGFRKLFPGRKAKKGAKKEETANPENAQVAAEVAKTASPGSYESMNASSLHTLPSTELIKIIYRYDAEVKTLNTSKNKQLKELSEARHLLSSLRDEVALHKDHNEKLNEEIHSSELQVKELTAGLDQKNHQLEIFKTQLEAQTALAQSYKSQLEESTQPLQDLEPADDSHLEIYKAELARLKAQLRQDKQNEQKVQELTITTKTLQNELEHQQRMYEGLQTQLGVVNRKVTELEQENKTLDLNLHKKQIELQTEGEQLSMIKFQKESMQTELKALKEQLSQREKHLSKSEAKHEQLAAEHKAKVEELLNLQHQTTQLTEQHQAALTALAEKHQQELSNLERTHAEAMQLLQAKETLELPSPIPSDTGEAHELTELREANKELQQANCKLEARVRDLKLKQDAAKSEVIKLLQKLKQREEPPPPEFKLNTHILSFAETKPLLAIKREIDSTYKTLMSIMATGPEQVTIAVQDFTLFEKKLNNLLMQVHEAVAHLESQEMIALPTQKPPARGPVKLFACMKPDDDTHSVMRPRTILGKRLASNTGGPRVVNQPEPQAVVNQRRGSLGYGKLQ